MSVYYAYGYTMKGLLGLVSRCRVHGREHVPARGAAIIACNHVFDLDSQYLGVALLPRVIHYMAKQELLEKPVIGPFLRACHVYPVNRKNPGPSFLKHTLAVLRQGDLVGIFPEGTRSAEGGPLKTGAVRLALKAHVPIIPAHYRGPDRWRDLLRRPLAEIRFGPPLDLSPHAGRPVTDGMVASLVEELAAAMQRLATAAGAQAGAPASQRA